MRTILRLVEGLAGGGAAVVVVVVSAGAVLIALLGLALAVRLRRRRRAAPRRVEERLEGCRGPVSARPAFQAVRRHLERLDPGWRLTSIGAGESVDHLGTSYFWEVLADLPSRDARAVACLRPLDPNVESEAQDLVVEIEVLPGLLTAADGGALPGLPTDFVDSPAAVAELCRQGADFLEGDRSMTLGTKRTGPDRAVWRTTCRGREVRTPFAVQRDPGELPEWPARSERSAEPKEATRPRRARRERERDAGPHAVPLGAPSTRTRPA